MAVTEAQVIAAIAHNNTISLNLAATPYNKVTIDDVEDYSFLLYSPPTVTASTLLKIVSPVGTPVYENPGFATDDYSSPDFEFGSITQVANIELPHITGGTTIIAGTYTVYVKQRIQQLAVTIFAVQKTMSFDICIDLLKCAKLKATYNCLSQPPTFTVEDVTNLSGANGFVFFEVTRTIEIAPPFGSDLGPVFGSANPFTQSPLWTGTYGYAVEGFIYFKKEEDTIIVRYASGPQELLVVCSDVLCKMYCCLVGLRKDYYAEANGAQKELIWKRLMLGFMEYNMAVRAQLCGDTETVASYTAKFYEVTGCNANCKCCDEEMVAPVIPIGTGPQGPQGDKGDKGDAGPKGDTGSQGPIGPTGGSILFNQYPNTATLGTGWETLIFGDSGTPLIRTPYIMVGNQLSVNGDELFMRAGFILPADPTLSQHVRVTFAGNDLCNNLCIFTPGAVNLRRGDIEIRLTRIDNVTVKYIMIWKSRNLIAVDTYGPPVKEIIFGVKTMAGLNLAVNQYDINCQGNSQVIGDIVCESFEVIYFKQKV